MNAGRITFLSLFLMCSLFATASLGADRWVELTTPGFRAVTNARIGSASKVLRHLDTFRHTVARSFRLSAGEQLPITVYIFRNRGSFEPYKPLFEGHSDNVGGFFVRSPDRNVIAVVQGQRHEETFRTILHEYAHLLTSRTHQPWPVWLSEGVADFYSTFEAGRSGALVGRPVTAHLQLLDRNPLLPLENLFAIDRQSPEYHHGIGQGVFYAQSWLLTHYLMLGVGDSERTQQFLDFAARVKDDRGKRLSLAVGNTYRHLERELRGYLRIHSFPTERIESKTRENSTALASRLLSGAEADVELGNLLLHLGRFSEAEEHYRRALASDPQFSGPYEGLGLVAIEKKERVVARQHFEKAIALGSENFLVHYHYARALQQTLEAGQPMGMGVNTAANIIERELETCITLMPHFAAAQRDLARFYLIRNEQLEEAWSLAQRAWELQPQDLWNALTVAETECRLEAFESCRTSLELVLALGPEARIREHAEALLKWLDQTTPVPSAKPQ